METSNQKSRTIIAVLYGYDDLRLRTYLQIVKTADYNLLAKTGVPETADCQQAWELILRRNAKELGSFEFDSYVNLAQSYASLLAEFNIIKATLVKMALNVMITGPKQYTVDDDDLELLKKKGYKLDLSSEQKYHESLAAALQRSNNIMTKIIMKHNELIRLSEANTGNNQESPGFEEVMADLDFHLGFAESRNLTLAGYNRLIKNLKQRARK